MALIGLYVRTSTSKQDSSLQKSELIQYCEFRKWADYKVYEDIASGIKEDRKEREQLMRDARRGRLKYVVVYRLDRFSRSMKDLVLTLNELEELGVKFISLHEAISTDSATGKFITNVIMSLASFERELLISRVRSGLNEAKRKGKVLGRPKTIRVDEILNLKKEGLSIRKIADKLNCSKSSVQRVLSGMSQIPCD